MKFFKEKINYMSRVLSPMASIWIFTYSIPNAIISMGGNETNNYHPSGYNSAGHAYIALAITGFSFIVLNAVYYSCYKEIYEAIDYTDNYEENPLINNLSSQTI